MTSDGCKGKIRLARSDQCHATVIQWYDEYSIAIFKYILKMIKDEQQTEDLTQDTFIKAYTYTLNNRDVDYPKTFLYRLAHNVTIDYIWKRKPLRMFENFFSYQKDPRPSVESIVEIRESSRTLYDALDALKPSYRNVILLRDIEGLSVRETAQVLGWSEAKVKSTAFRGKKALKKHLAKEGDLHE